MITKDLNRWPRPFRTQLCMNHICRHNRNRDWAITYIQLYWTKFRIPVVCIIGRTFMGMFWLFQQLPCPKCNSFHKKCNFLESAFTFLQFSSAFIFGALITLWSLIFGTIGKNQHNFFVLSRKWPINLINFVYKCSLPGSTP